MVAAVTVGHPGGGRRGGRHGGAAAAGSTAAEAMGLVVGCGGGGGGVLGAGEGGGNGGPKVAPGRPRDPGGRQRFQRRRRSLRCRRSRPGWRQPLARAAVCDPRRAAGRIALARAKRARKSVAAVRLVHVLSPHVHVGLRYAAVSVDVGRRLARRRRGTGAAAARWRGRRRWWRPRRRRGGCGGSDGVGGGRGSGADGVGGGGGGGGGSGGCESARAGGGGAGDGDGGAARGTLGGGRWPGSRPPAQRRRPRRRWRGALNLPAELPEGP